MALAPFGRSRVNCFEKTLQGGVSQNQQKNNMIRPVCQPKLFGSRPLRVREGTGIGLVSAETVVHKYNGSLHLETEEHLFRVNVLLNL